MIDGKFIRGLSIDWSRVPADSWLRGVPALASLDRLDLPGAATMLVGENGTGKSTLLEGIAVAYGFNPEGGTRNYHFSTYQDVSELEEAIRLVKGYRKRNSGYFFRAESFFNVATVTNLQYNDDGRLPDYHAQSHGESFLSFLQDKAREGVYLMDEPEAALSPQRQLTLMRHIYYSVCFQARKRRNYRTICLKHGIIDAGKRARSREKPCIWRARCTSES